ncbi:MAG: carbohydrate ABC transporter substrate-binding protein [Clostridiales bacterium]|nr:carbohydrate ABC transporter substrate-binding protein [Clostridiales bacterium]
MKKKIVSMVLALMMMMGAFVGCGSNSSAGTASTASATNGKTVYPKGKVVIYAYGQPQYLQQYYDAWLERNKDIASGVTIEIVQTKGADDSRQKVTTTYLSGSYDDLPDAMYIDPVNLMDLAKGDIVKDETALVTPLVDKMVSGAANDAKFQGKIYGLPDSVRPQMLFYNKQIFDKYGVDPSQMSTVEGYIEAGKQLKEKSNGKVYLSYIDPGSKTWRYWGRRGLMPQANAKIWDDEGNVVIGSDSGTKLALGALDTMYSQGLLLKSTIMEPALYDATRKGEVATFDIGAFWDEFLRKNVPETSGQWRVMSAPVFKDVGTAGAPVSSYFAIVNKKDGVYAGLCEKLWKDFNFDSTSRQEWVNKMVEQNAPYSNPISLDMLKNKFWKESSTFYGGESFRAKESEFLQNGSKNLVVTPQDAEADEIISAELEKYVAGSQSMKEAIANMDKNLKAKIGKAKIEK